MHISFRQCCLALMLLLPALLNAQDSLHISLPEAEQRLMQMNLALLAERFQINIAEAEIQQARLIDNPTIQVSGSAFNPQTRKWADIGNRKGQYIIDVQQVIRLAGKRSKEVALAQTAARLSTHEFYELLRSLRFSLRSNYYEALFLQASINAYRPQIVSMDSLATQYNKLQQQGLVTLKDAMRIQALALSLKADEANLQNQMNEVQAELQILLRTAAIIKPQEQKAEAQLPPALLDSALLHRRDLAARREQVNFSQQNLQLQKALAVPNLTLGAEFDKRGNYVDNTTMISVAIDLPFFNRNQGRIRQADFSLKRDQLLVNVEEERIKTQVRKAENNYQLAQKMLQATDPSFLDKMERLTEAMRKNFQARNISLLEFTDFFDSYRQHLIQQFQLRNQQRQAAEELNYTIGKTVIN